MKKPTANQPPANPKKKMFKHEADRILDPRAPLNETKLMEEAEAPGMREDAAAANRLPREEQLTKFRKDLVAHDGGNQPGS